MFLKKVPCQLVLVKKNKKINNVFVPSALR